MRTRPLLALLAAGVLLAGCGGEGDAPAGEEEILTDPSGDAGLAGTLTVFAAASLTDVFTEVGDRLEQENPGLEVQLNVAGSAALAAQLEQGAPADVFAPADEAQMARVVDAGLATGPELFASNRLMLALPLDNPAGIEQPEQAGIPGIADLLVRDVTLAVCAPEVPCGAAAAEVLDRAGLSDVPDTYEDDVRAVLTKVLLGEVDAGLVYRTDVQTAGNDVVALAFREAEAARNRYPVAVLEEAPNREAAQAFVDLVLSDEGRQLVADAGFFEP
ncbi:molybdate ABC transporter substrate-binding protein [Blastococcus haudaquaticus]|uniref:Molybdate transport system substrate-binding protein n=1 Tax=Blastococcus haudaquaticus TaxID=1938745 RepID=A0A286GJK8_9ACTN|nr:molybdate ABC transporter substrate-binding protein [Blastococcus haudaquaticus]SOD95174.1 molybdate transport system substrate-binding protein [Blastococcus haudaquaticus]